MSDIYTPMTADDLVGMDLLEIKGLPISDLEEVCASPRPEGVAGLRWGDARYALSLRRAPRRPY